ncbi:hypothetical protein [Caballeronia sp. GAWG1-1]|uniref:hypothetical protein n=1 Tax=Caballeronia sp. GAWG1-1 TaxID=2921742 RepID=UPI002027CDDB|nr:hypothetical protein [Caballeronia sp. GAWG1-1]
MMVRATTTLFSAEADIAGRTMRPAEDCEWMALSCGVPIRAMQGGMRLVSFCYFGDSGKEEKVSKTVI